MNYPICTASLECLSKTYEDSPQQKAQFYSPIYDLVGAKEEPFFFFGSHQEAILEVLYSFYFEQVRKTGKNHFITASSEDAPILLTLKRLEDAGCMVDTLPFQNGKLNIKALSDLISPKTALVSLSWANGLLGTIHDIDTLGSICKQHHIPLHVDASEVLGKLFCSFTDSNISYLTFSGSSLHAPGCGALFVKKEEEFHVQTRAQDLPRLAALSAAARQSILYMDQMAMETSRLRDLFESTIKEQIPSVKVLYPEERLPHISALSFPGVFHEALEYCLQKRGVIATSGGGLTQPFVQILQDFSAMHFSFSRYTTEEEIQRISSIVSEEALALQRISKGLFT